MGSWRGGLLVLCLGGRACACVCDDASRLCLLALASLECACLSLSMHKESIRKYKKGSTRRMGRKHSMGGRRVSIYRRHHMRVQPYLCKEEVEEEAVVWDGLRAVLALSTRDTTIATSMSVCMPVNPSPSNSNSVNRAISSAEAATGTTYTS